MSAPAFSSPTHQPQYQPVQPRNSMGTAGFVLGLLAALFAMIPIIGSSRGR